MRILLELLESKRNRWICLAVSAILLGVTVCFPVIGVLEWIVLVPMAAVLFFEAGRERLSPGKAYLWGLVFFELFLAVVYHWFFYMYPLDFLGMSPLVAAMVVVLACFGLALLHAVPGALLFPLLLVAARGKAAKRVPILVPVLAASLWCVYEWALTLGWTGVPWARLALGQMKLLPMVQTASLFGPYGITFLIVLVNFLLAYALLDKKRMAAAVSLLLVAVNLAIGGALTAKEPAEGEPVRMAAVQGNVSSKDKWDDDSFIDSLTVYTGYTQQAAADGATVVVWPESVVPYSINEMPAVDSYLRTLAKTESVYLFVGGFLTVGEETYNAVYAYAPDGSLNESFYFKRRLVPFGEFLPMEGFFRTFIPPLANMNALGKDLKPGNDSNLVETDMGTFACLICFDSIYEELARDSVKDGGEVILLPTNDSWFSDSAALYMHNRQAALRAIENGRYVVRAANTGISSVITPCGEVVESVGALRKGYIVSDVYLKTDTTLYTRIGNVVVWLSMALYLGVLVFDTVAKKKENKKR